jgi:hypothetical protein
LLLRHLSDELARGIGNPLRTTSKSRLLFKYTSNIVKVLGDGSIQLQAEKGVARPQQSGPFSPISWPPR